MDFNSKVYVMHDAMRQSRAVQEAEYAAKRFIHPGSPSGPRIVDAMTMAGVRDIRVSLPPGSCVGVALREAIDTFACAGGCGRIVAGACSTIQYHLITKASGGTRPYVYGSPITCTGVNVLIGAAITLGHLADGARIMHCHGGFIDEHGGHHGGHLVLDETIVASEPLIVRLCLFEDLDFVASPDRETTFDLLLPVKAR